MAMISNGHLLILLLPRRHPMSALQRKVFTMVYHPQIFYADTRRNLRANLMELDEWTRHLTQTLRLCHVSGLSLSRVSRCTGRLLSAALNESTANVSVLRYGYVWILHFKPRIWW